MIESYKLYLPKSQREVKIWVSVPRIREGVIFDTLYLLDGQNAFKDSNAAFGRSIRATKCLGYVARDMKKRILGVAIENSGSDMGRINEYTPFKIDNPASDNWTKQDTRICEAFCHDFINTIIPFVENKYNTYKSKDHRFIYGSSLAAITAVYLGFKFQDSFKYIGAFSTASFLFEKKFNDFLEKNKKTDRDVFIYVGEKEESDDIYSEDAYLESAKSLHSFCLNNNIRTRLVIDPYGIHNEEYWGNHLLDFISFIYSDTVLYIPR